MFLAALDPALLFPPDAINGTWVLRTREWTTVARHGCLVVTCPTALHEHALAAWWTRREQLTIALAAEESPLAHQDLVLVVEELRGRLAPRAMGVDAEAVVTNVTLSPTYVSAVLEPPRRGEFEQHLGELGYTRSEIHNMAMVLTDETSWSSSPHDIEVQADIEMLLVGDIVEDVDEDSRSLREHLVGCCSPADVYETLLLRAGELVPYPALAVQAYAITSLGLGSDMLRFTVGEAFVESLEGMNYAVEHGRARTCWRTMATIAAGKTGEVTGLDAHPVRRGDGGGAEVVRDGGGRTLMRGSLATSANAHRLHWWTGDAPEFVNVSGHDDPIPL